MVNVKNIEKKIWDIEEFDVARINGNGSNTRGYKVVPVNYSSYNRKAKNGMTVSEWKKIRFSKTFPGYSVDVLDCDGNSVPGNTKIGTVRDSYSED